MQARSDARLSTHSGAPSLHPSLASTLNAACLSDVSDHHYSTASLSSTCSSSSRSPIHRCHLPATSIAHASPRHLPAAAATTAIMYSSTSHPQPHYPAASVPAPPLMGAATARSSNGTLSSTDSRTADLRSFARALDKMADARLDSQRYVMSGHQSEEFGKIALGAKLDRALSRRMVGQDAVFSVRPMTTTTTSQSVARSAATTAVAHSHPNGHPLSSSLGSSVAPSSLTAVASVTPSPPSQVSALDEKRALEVRAA